MTRKTLARLIGAGFLLALGFAGWSYAQPVFSNNLFALGGNAGVTPQLQAVGTDTNISINLVPKGTGTVQVNGTAITAGTTFPTLTVTPGPANISGGLFMTPGTSVALEGVGGVVLANSSTNVTTTLVATEQDLFNFPVLANTLSANNQHLHLVFRVRTAATANGKQLRMYFGATLIGDGTNVASNNNWFAGDCYIWRTAAAAEKAVCGAVNITNAGSWATAGGGGMNISTPAENTAGPITVRITGTDAVAAGGTNLEGVNLYWYPAGQ
jgi:hypothetical protein